MVNFVDSTQAGARQVTPDDLDAAFAAKCDVSALEAETARALAAELKLSNAIAAGAGTGSSGALTADGIAAALASADLVAGGGAQIAYSGSNAIAPTANPTLATSRAFTVQGTTAHNNQREFLACFGLASTMGDKKANSATVNDKVALYAGISSATGSGDIWALNSVTEVGAGSNNVTAQGYELDFNNLSNDKSQDFANAAYGLSLTGASTYACTAAMLVSEFNPRWTRGVWFANNCVQDVAILDTTSSNTILRGKGTHGTGIDFGDCNFTSYAISLKAGIVGLLTWTNGIQTVSDNVDSNLNRTVGVGSAAVYTGGTVLAPLSDNSTSLGTPALRWNAVYAVNGAIQTSDVTQKTNIAPLPAMLPLVRDLDPIRFNWMVGGHETVKVRKLQTVQATETVTQERVEHVEKDGKIVARTVSEQVERPAFDEVPVHDEDGNPMVDRVEGDLHQSAREVPRVHMVPRMVEREVEVEEMRPVEGKRRHWGFAAQDVKAAMDRHGMGDFGGHVVTEDGQQALRPDQMIPVLWKAVQELAAKVDELSRGPVAASSAAEAG